MKYSPALSPSGTSAVFSASAARGTYHSGDRVNSMIQLVIQVRSPSTENACSQRERQHVVHL
jgi:hypothetical protein